MWGRCSMRRAAAAKTRKSVYGCAAAAVFAALIGVSGCASSDPLAEVANNSDTGFIEGDGATTSIAVSERTEPVEFEGVTDTGEHLSDKDFRGSVTVVNFWYAGCAPCRAEAADLVSAAAEFEPQGVKFLGINTRDQAAQAIQFAEQYDIKYPSILDVAENRAVQAAFAGQIPLNAVPTTLVLDAEGRVAHRIVGQIASESHLTTLIKETLAEQAAAGPADSNS